MSSGFARRWHRYDAAYGDAVAMSVSPPSHRSTPPPALSAFLRGVERRGAVLAELQAGDAGAGDTAVAAAMAQFRDEAQATPMAQWPPRFWSLLLAQPMLRSRTAVALPIDVTDRLGELGSGPRAALLLRVAAGLSEEDAAAVLGVSHASYRLALQRALPHHADGRADPDAWLRLREQIHRRIKTLPPERLARLGGAREAALEGATPEASSSRPGAAAPRSRPRWLLPVLWTLLVLCALALAATFLVPGGALESLTAGAGQDRVRVEPLPESGSPASRFDAQTALATHRDFALLADPQGEEAARNLDFDSWLAAQQAAGITAPEQLPIDVPPADAVATPAAAGEATGSETDGESHDAGL